jgi:hypothetical protein
MHHLTRLFNWTMCLRIERNKTLKVVKKHFWENKSFISRRNYVRVNSVLFVIYKT